MRAWRLVAALAACAACPACGDNARPAVTADAAGGCTATFTGNFGESSAAPTCATITTGSGSDTTLELAIPSQMLPPSVTVDVDLGATPSPGHYSSATVSSWTARGVQHVGNGVCLYNGGSTAVPTGSFELDLASIAGHGTLTTTLYVLAFPATECGAGDVEMIHVGF